MNIKLKGRLASGLAAVALQFLIAGTASAHHLDLTAVGVCDENNEPVIEYTATAWTPFNTNNLINKRTNPLITILVNGIPADSGAFVNPTFQFSGSIPAPGGATAVVMARADAAWGDGYPGGQSDSLTVDLPQECTAPGTGRFTGGGWQIRLSDGLKVTRGLTIHCDLLLSNNLEINWPTGNKFHMLEHLETVACTDDPNIIQQPPPAPLDTLIGKGTGRYNNVPGFSVEFTLVDAGEPGGNDQMAIKIYETANPSNVVLDVPLQLLTNGNLQAHYDQPHK
jgi:hypothetical protein